MFASQSAAAASLTVNYQPTTLSSPSEAQELYDSLAAPSPEAVPFQNTTVAQYDLWRSRRIRSTSAIIVLTQRFRKTYLHRENLLGIETGRTQDYKYAYYVAPSVQVGNQEWVLDLMLSKRPTELNEWLYQSMNQLAQLSSNKLMLTREDTQCKTVESFEALADPGLQQTEWCLLLKAPMHYTVKDLNKSLNLLDRPAHEGAKQSRRELTDFVPSEVDAAYKTVDCPIHRPFWQLACDPRTHD